MRRKIEKGTDEFQFFADFYKFRQDYHEPEPKDSKFWEEMVAVGENLIRKYEKTDISSFVQKLIMDHFEDLEVRYHNNIKKGVLRA